MKDSVAEVREKQCADAERGIKICLASNKEEKWQIYRFRYGVFVEEMNKSIVISSEHESKLIYDKLDEKSILLYAQAGFEIVGTLRVSIGRVEDFPIELTEIFFMRKFKEYYYGRPNQKLALCTKLAVAPKYRGSQVLYLLLARAYEILRDMGIQFNFGGCNPCLVSLYEQLGFLRFAPNFIDPGYGLLVPIVMIMEDIDHLRIVRSPLLRIARNKNNSLEAANWFRKEFPRAASFINSKLISKEELWLIISKKVGQSPKKGIPMLRLLSKTEAMTFLHIGTVIFCAKGDCLVTNGDMSNELYILLSGVLKETYIASGRLISSLVTVGQSFGEFGLLKAIEQTVDVHAVEDSEIFVISRQVFEKFRHSHPFIADKVISTIDLIKENRYTNVF